jgi:heme-degrading monooxygenase HmoA
MYARVVSVQVALEGIDEAEMVFRDRIMPSLLETEGFRGAVLLTDRSSGSGTTITVWESDAHARANEESGMLRQNLGRIQHLLRSAPAVEGYEVRVFQPGPIDPKAMRVMRVQLRPEKVDEASEVYRDSILPAAQEQPGFRGALLAVDPTTGKGISATAWDSKADLEAGEMSGYLREQLAKVAPHFTSEPERQVFDVAMRVLRDR